MNCFWDVHPHVPNSPCLNMQRESSISGINGLWIIVASIPCSKHCQSSSNPVSYLFYFSHVQYIFLFCSPVMFLRLWQEYPVPDGVRLSPPHPVQSLTRRALGPGSWRFKHVGSEQQQDLTNLREKRADPSVQRLTSVSCHRFCIPTPGGSRMFWKFLAENLGNCPQLIFFLYFFFPPQKYSTDTLPISLPLHWGHLQKVQYYLYIQYYTPWRSYSTYFIHCIHHPKRRKVFKEGLVWD